MWEFPFFSPRAHIFPPFRGHLKRSHTLRYVLLNRSTQNPYLVILFTLHLAEDINPGDGSLKPDAARALELEQAGLKVTGADEGEMIAQEEELELEPDDEGFAEEERIGGEIGKFEGEVD